MTRDVTVIERVARVTIVRRRGNAIAADEAGECAVLQLRWQRTRDLCWELKAASESLHLHVLLSHCNIYSPTQNT